MNHRVRGRIAKKVGDNWENLVKITAYRQGWGVLHIHPGCKSLSLSKLIRIKNPFDLVLVKDSFAVFIDAKTIKSKNYAVSMVTAHQVKDLMQCEKHGFMAGYLVHFQTQNVISFLKASKLIKLGHGESLSPEDGIVIGSRESFNLGLLKEDF